MEEVTRETIVEFTDLMFEIGERIKEAFDLLPSGSMIRKRADAYWRPTMLNSIEAGGCGKSTMVVMNDTRQELEELVEEQEAQANSN